MRTQQSTTMVEQFMDDPIAYFGESLTQMHSIPRDELEELQRHAMAIRFGQHRESIEMVRKLADRLGITELTDFNDVVPLLFSHTAFKSYPAVLIDNKSFVFKSVDREIDGLPMADIEMKFIRKAASK